VPATAVRPQKLALNRWGKTPITWYSESGWHAAQFDMLSFDMAKAPGRTYRYYTGEPQFPFGSGLSYSHTTLAAHAVPGTSTIAVEVRNADVMRVTDEVVFLYVVAMAGTVASSEPSAKLIRSLVAFERLGPIPPGFAANATFVLRPEMLTVSDAHGYPTLHAGRYGAIVSTGNAEVKVNFICEQGACRALVH